MGTRKKLVGGSAAIVDRLRTENAALRVRQDYLDHSVEDVEDMRRALTTIGRVAPESNEWSPAEFMRSARRVLREFREGGCLADLRARLEAAEADLLAEVRRLREENSIYRSRYGCPSCGEQHPAACMCPPHEVRTTGRCWFDGVRKVMVVEITRLRQERDAARAELERAQAEAAAMREALEKFNQWWFAQNYEADGPILISEEEVGALAFAARRAVSPGAGAALLAEVTRLREVERLAKAYRSAVTERRAHKGVDPNTDDSPLGTKWGRRMEELTTAKRAAGEELFDALGKEDDRG